MATVAMLTACRLAISLTVRPTRANRPGMHDVASLVEMYLAAERALVAAVESAGGAVPLLGEGIDPNTVLKIWWPRSTELALRGSVRRLAG